VVADGTIHWHVQLVEKSVDGCDSVRHVRDSRGPNGVVDGVAVEEGKASVRCEAVNG
jgi:hypothetical protein